MKRMVLTLIVGCILPVTCTLAQSHHGVERASDSHAQNPGKASSRNFEIYARRAGAAQKAGREVEAIQFYRKALQVKHDWADGWLRMGMLLADRKQFVQAGEAFQNVMKLRPKEGTAWALLGLCEYGEGHYTQAYNHMEYGRSLGVNNPDLEKVATFHSALVMLRTKEFFVAHHLLVHLAREGVQDPDLVTAFGLAALRIAKTPDRVDPAKEPLVNRVGQIELASTHNPTAVIIAEFKQLLSENPNEPRVHYAFGNFLIGAGRYQSGIEQMKRDLALDPGDYMAMLQVAMTFLNQGRDQDALPYARHAVKLASNLFVAHYALGWILYKLGQIPPATKELQLAERLSPNSPEVHYALSVVYMHSARAQDARRERRIFAHMKRLKAASKLAPPAQDTSVQSSVSGGP